MLVTVGSYGERCQCDNSTDAGACPVGRDSRLLCSGRFLYKIRLERLEVWLQVVYECSYTLQSFLMIV